MSLAQDRGAAMRRQTTPRGRAQPRVRSAGFTLIELMVVLVVILVAVGLAAPAISNAMHERRAAEATLDVVRLARHARSAAAAYGRAHLVTFVAGGSGVVQVWRGVSNRCNGNVWSNQTFQTVMGGDCHSSDYCIDQMNMDERYKGAKPITLAPVGPAFDICYEPTGMVRWRDGGSNAAFLEVNSPAIGGGARYQITPLGGVVRTVVLPLGGDARVVR
jgi:prepilin-type N-terminal cleavage/methylation domain-containing protein